MAEKGYKRLKVYQKAHEWVKEIYKITEKFPRSEIFGLASQMRRAAVSVAANIVEGQARSGKKEFKYFLGIANGSLVEAEYYCELSLDLNYISPKEYEILEKLRLELGMMLGALIRSIKA